MQIKLRKYEQALAILPGCKGLDKSVLYDRLKYSGYRWSARDRRWIDTLIAAGGAKALTVGDTVTAAHTIESLQDKTFKVLRRIGRELNVVPKGNGRCRQDWIDAIAGANSPLLQLLEVPPGVEPVQVTKPLMERLDPAECDKLTFLELVKLCRDTDKCLADKSLGQLQNLSSKVRDCTGRPGELLRGNKRLRAFWIEQTRSELTCLLRMRSVFRLPRGLGGHEPYLYQKPIIEDFEALVLWFSFKLEPLAAIEVQAQEPIEPVELYDYEMKPGEFLSSGEIFDKTRGSTRPGARIFMCARAKCYQLNRQLGHLSN